MKGTQKELDTAIGELVDEILERGRLNKLEMDGTLKVKDGGLTLRRTVFIQQIKNLAKTEVASEGPQTHYGEVTMYRVDRDKPAMRDEARTGLEHLSENEE